MEGTEGTGSSGGGGGESFPPTFRVAVTALSEARTRPEIRIAPLPAPRRLAPYAFALEAAVTEPEDAGQELADGRFVLLHDPEGQESWQGTFRVVTLGRAELEAEIASDPLLPEVTWTWLTGALEARGAGYAEPSGTVTRSSSAFFGGLAERTAEEVLEIRASWTPEGARRMPPRIWPRGANSSASAPGCPRSRVTRPPSSSSPSAGARTRPARLRGHLSRGSERRSRCRGFSVAGSMPCGSLCRQMSRRSLCRQRNVSAPGNDSRNGNQEIRVTNS